MAISEKFQPVKHTAPPEDSTPPKPLSREESKKRLNVAINSSNEMLACGTTVLTPFPDTLAIDRTKVTVTKRSFFKTSEVIDMRIEDILNVTAQVGPVFGSLKIYSRIFNNDMPYTVGLFWRGDTLKLKRILQGYVIAMQRKIDCSALHTKELSHMLDQLGADAPTQ